jgi:hypothetical protein
VRADNPIVLDSNGDRLCVAKTIGGRMTSGASVIVIQAGYGIEP